MPHNSDERHDFEDSDHRLAGAEPATVPEGAPRDENDDPVLTDDTTGFVHVTCPECGNPGAAVNQESSGDVWVGDVEELGYCFGEFGVVFHK